LSWVAETKKLLQEAQVLMLDVIDVQAVSQFLQLL